jgi:hypothetical protein
MNGAKEVTLVLLWLSLDLPRDAATVAMTTLLAVRRLRQPSQL